MFCQRSRTHFQSMEPAIKQVQKATLHFWVNIYDLLAKCDRRLFTTIKSNVNHPSYALLPKVKESFKRLRSQATQLPRINTERFKNCYFNRRRFKYNLAINQCSYPMFYHVLYDNCKESVRFSWFVYFTLRNVCCEF